MLSLFISTARRAHFAWAHNFGLRLGVGLSLILFLVMGAGSGVLIVQQDRALTQAAEERARAIARTFAAVGSAAVLDSLYRLQESLQLFLQDDSLLEIDIVDPDNLVVASKQPARIGTILNDPEWLTAREAKREVIFEARLNDGQRTLVIIEPLFDRDELAAWVRMVVSLAEIEQERSQAFWRLLAVTVALLLIGLHAIRRVLHKTSTVLQGIASNLQSAIALPKPRESTPLLTVSSLTPRGDFERLVALTTEAAATLSTQALALHDLAQSLEDKVASRTTELEEARTQAVQSLEELRESEARLRSLVDNAADGILVTDAEWTIESANPAACSLFGCTMAELRGREVHALLLRTPGGPERPTRTEAKPYLVTKPGEEVFGQRRDGTSFQAELSVSEMTIAGASHYTIIVHDVSERRHMEEIKQRSARRLHRLGEERAQLYHDLHDSLLQSLSAVSMGLEASKLLLVEAPHRATHQLDQTLSHLRRVIHEARDFLSRLELRTTTHEDFLHSLQALVESRDGWPCPVFQIDVDPVIAGQLSIEREIHLLAIAREAVSNTVHHARASSGSIRFGLWGGAIRLEIRDDGIGFSPVEVANMSPGLANMATHVKKLHGRLTIESAPGEGTVILVAIPQPQEAQLTEGTAHAF